MFNIFKVTCLMFVLLVPNFTLAEVGQDISRSLKKYDARVTQADASPAGFLAQTIDKQLISQLYYPEVVEQLYEQNDNQLIWFQPDAVEALELQLSIFDYAEISDQFSQRLTLLKLLKDGAKVFEYDVVAVDTLLRFQIYIKYVQQFGEKWLYGQGIQLPNIQPDRPTINNLQHAISESTLDKYVAQQFSLAGQMDLLTGHINQLNKAINKPLLNYWQQGSKREGDFLTHKSILLDRLQALSIQVLSSQYQDDYFDSHLVSQIKTFQRIHGIESDGVIGRNTLYWINYSLKERRRVLALNIERSRLVPNDQLDRVIVNIPSFELNYWNMGERKFSSRVIVGRKKRKTPMLNISMKRLIVNPYWNVPRKLVKKDIIPLAKKDPNYLARNKFRILDNWQNYNEIAADSLDWENIDASTFPYFLTQAPGKNNALGAYKFDTPNARAIFLHDTPAKYLFAKSSRAFSSGCVRVEHADRFAQVILATQGIELPQIDKDENLTLPLNKQIPVNIVYQTAWLEHGLINYRQDIYGYDIRTNELRITKNHNQ